MTSLAGSLLRAVTVIVLITFSIALVSFMALSFLEFDGFRPLLALDVDFTVFRSEMMRILLRTAVVSTAAAAIAFTFVELAIGSARSVVKPLSIITLYSVDPVLRTRSFHSAELQGAELMSGLLPGALLAAWSELAVPAISLAITYAPIYASVRIWDVLCRTKTAYQHKSRLLYTSLQPAFRRAPLALSVLFLFALFDPWIAAVASGRRHDYWGSLALRRAQARDLDTALSMCLLGFLVAVIFALALLIIRHVWERYLPLLRPHPKPGAAASPGRQLLWYGILAISAWPFFWLLTSGIVSSAEGPSRPIQVVVDTTVICALILFGTAVFSSVVLGFLFSATGRVSQFVRASCWIIVLTPELVFSVGSTYLAASGVIQPGIWWAVFLFSGFTVALAVLTVSEFLVVSGSRHMPLLCQTASQSLSGPVRVLVLGYGRLIVVAALLVTWLVLENVMLLRTALGASYTTVAVTLFDGIARSADWHEIQIVLIAFLAKVLVFGWCVYSLLKKEVVNA